MLGENYRVPKMGKTHYNTAMRVINRDRLAAFQKQNAEARGPLAAWYAHVSQAEWTTPQDVQMEFGNDVIIPKGRAVFNIKGKKYRIVVAINYQFQIVDIRFIGTHKDYNEINALTI